VVCRDEDHLALFMELLGPMPRRVWGAGRLSREFFTRQGTLRHIRKLRHWPLDRVLLEKYDVPADEVAPPAASPRLSGACACAPTPALVAAGHRGQQSRHADARPASRGARVHRALTRQPGPGAAGCGEHAHLGGSATRGWGRGLRAGGRALR